jgi:hypothetical protein
MCPDCGWDLTTAVTRAPKERLGRRLGRFVVRLVIWGLVVALPVVGFMRVRTVGPGPDLATTLRWMVLGDDGRAAELVTLHRAHEIGSAAARFAVRNMDAPPFDGDWAVELAPYATMNVRGWVPMLFLAGDTDMAPPGVRELYEVRSTDGWGRPYRVETSVFRGDVDPAADPEFAADFADGLQTSFFNRVAPDLDRASQWMRLELVSAGADGVFGSSDDVVFVSLFPIGFTFRLRGSDEALRAELSRAYALGRQYFRFTAHRGDLIDARLLAEWRLEALL